ncbi:MAG: hypothetical protein KC645_16440 [Gemmatimonadetes bacterium]|nr:hypothetical protein [Gemmatimonadota bacterium]
MRRPTLRAALLQVPTFAIWLSACSTYPEGPIRMVRPDGVSVECNAPAQEIADAALPEIGAALSGLLETLQSQAPVEQKADEFRPLASTPAELDVLDYRICLEFGEGVLDAADFTQWREQIRPMLATGMRSVSELTARAPSA